MSFPAVSTKHNEQTAVFPLQENCPEIGKFLHHLILIFTDHLRESNVSARPVLGGGGGVESASCPAVGVRYILTRTCLDRSCLGDGSGVRGRGGTLSKLPILPFPRQVICKNYHNFNFKSKGYLVFPVVLDCV